MSQNCGLVVGLCRIVKRHRLSFLNLALAVCWTRPQFTRNVRTDLIPAQSGSLLVSHIDDPPQEWAGFDLEIITRFLEETNPRPPSSLKTLCLLLHATLPSHIQFFQHLQCLFVFSTSSVHHIPGYHQRKL